MKMFGAKKGGERRKREKNEKQNASTVIHPSEKERREGRQERRSDGERGQRVGSQVIPDFIKMPFCWAVYILKQGHVEGQACLCKMNRFVKTMTHSSKRGHLLNFIVSSPHPIWPLILVAKRFTVTNTLFFTMDLLPHI